MQNYFSYLSKILHEADLQTEEVDKEDIENKPVTPENIPVENEEIPEEEQSEEDTYIEEPTEEIVPKVDLIIKQEKKKKLFENFEELEKLIKYTKESLDEKINFDLLDAYQIKGVNIVINSFENLFKKIEDFLMKSINAREYEECLYFYMLIRSEFLTNIKFIRKILGLNARNDEKDAQKP